MQMDYNVFSHTHGKKTQLKGYCNVLQLEIKANLCVLIVLPGMQINNWKALLTCNENET